MLCAPTDCALVETRTWMCQTDIRHFQSQHTYSRSGRPTSSIWTAPVNPVPLILVALYQLHNYIAATGPSAKCASGLGDTLACGHHTAIPKILFNFCHLLILCSEWNYGIPSTIHTNGPKTSRQYGFELLMNCKCEKSKWMNASVWVTASPQYRLWLKCRHMTYA